MTMQDPIADMLTRIRNAHHAKHASTSMPYSNIKEAISKVLKDEGFIQDFSVSGDVMKTLTIELKYFEGKSVIASIQRKSRPGLRLYQKSDQLDRVLGGLGLAIVSTSKGVMSAERARSLRLGGEVLCWVT